MITGKDLVAWGVPQGPWYGETITFCNRLVNEGMSLFDIEGLMKQFEPPRVETIPNQDPSLVPIHYNISPDEDAENLAKVKFHMEELAKVPTIRALSVMPDACPCGSAPGTIPVGGVAVAEKAIHPGMHSADICCSVAVSVFKSGTDGKRMLDAGMNLSHFGPGGRPSNEDMVPLPALLDKFQRNFFLTGTPRSLAEKHYGTQGDGNHFFYVGRLESTGEIALVTHHGSRGPGAELYKKGMRAAQKYTEKISPLTSKYNAWLSIDTDEGFEYWNALQLIREWTRGNHFIIHNAIAKEMSLEIQDRFWNEHNFVFWRDKYFVHAKGATPNYKGFADDEWGRTLIPLNMASPILVTRVWETPGFGMDFMNDSSLGFCPHGAGRNMSRTKFTKDLAQDEPKRMIAEMIEKFDVRAYSGKYDISEFPQAYKAPEAIIAAIKDYGLTEIVDKINPIGSIMAGHCGHSRRDT